MQLLSLIAVALAVKTSICATVPSINNSPETDVAVAVGTGATNATISGEENNSSAPFYTAALCTGYWHSGTCKYFRTRGDECRNLNEIGMEHLTLSIKLWTGSQCVFYWKPNCPHNGKKELYTGNHPNVFPLGLWYSSGHCYQY